MPLSTAGEMIGTAIGLAKFAKDEDLKKLASVVVQLCERVDDLEAKLKPQKTKVVRSPK